MANILIKKPINTSLKQEREELNEFMSQYNSWTEFVLKNIAEYGDENAILDTHNGVELTFSKAAESINTLASAFQAKGIQRGDFVALISENNGLHLVCHHAIMKAGACSALRGTSSPNEELEYILNHSDSKGLVIPDYKTLARLADIINNNQNLQFVVVLFEKGDRPENINKPVHTIKEFMEFGQNNG